MINGILVEETESGQSKIWLSEGGESLEVPTQRLPSNAGLGSWLSVILRDDSSISNIRLEKYDARVQLSVSGEVEVLEWFVVRRERRGWAFCRGLGWLSLAQSFTLPNEGIDTAFLLRATWDRIEGRFVILQQRDKGCVYKGDDRAVYEQIIDVLDNRQNRSVECRSVERGEGRRGQGVHSESDDGEGGWLDAVVCGLDDAPSGRFFFLSTLRGICVLHPGVVPEQSELCLGTYARVRTAFMSDTRAGKCNTKVVALKKIGKPKDHEVIPLGRDILIKCDATLLGESEEIPEWYLLENKFLGRIATFASRIAAEDLRPGAHMRVTVKRSRNNIPANISQWLLTEIDTSNRYYEGYVVHTSEKSGKGQFGYVVCMEFDHDIILPPNSKENERLLGRWIRFRIETDPTRKPGFNRRVVRPFDIIDDVYPSRILRNVCEVLVRCEYEGGEEDGRPLLSSPLGFVRDESGLMQRRGSGHFTLWIARHFRSCHKARWKISFYEKLPLDCDQEERSSVNIRGRMEEDDGIQRRLEWERKTLHLEDRKAEGRRQGDPSWQQEGRGRFENDSNRDWNDFSHETRRESERHSVMDRKDAKHSDYGSRREEGKSERGEEMQPRHVSTSHSRSHHGSCISRPLEEERKRDTETASQQSASSDEKAKEIIRLLKRCVYAPSVRDAILAHDRQAYNDILMLCMQK